MAPAAPSGRICEKMGYTVFFGEDPFSCTRRRLHDMPFSCLHMTPALRQGQIITNKRLCYLIIWKIIVPSTGEKNGYFLQFLYNNWGGL